MKDANCTAQSFKRGGLQWSLAQVCQFLAQHFQGCDRIWELQEHELTTYLYRLQVAALAPEKC